MDTTLKLILVSCLLLSAQSLAACDARTELSGKVKWLTSQTISIQAGAGDLRLVGNPDSEHVKYIAQVCVNDQKELAELDVKVNQNDTELKLTTVYPRVSRWFTTQPATIDLLIEVPQAADLSVVDSSGRARIQNVGSLTMVDSSGELLVQQIAGDLSLTDASGSIKVNSVIGDVSITDRSDAISVHTVQGNVRVDEDGSGAIWIERVSGDVLVELDGSGDINVDQIGGQFTVMDDGSGTISHRQVAGAVIIPK